MKGIETIPNDTHVTVYEDGTTSNGSKFSAIGDEKFYLDDIEYTVKEGHLVVSGYAGDEFSGTANIVSGITYKGNTYEVLEVEQSAFSLCESLTSVNIPDSVTSIGVHAFANCYLTSIVIPESVTSIGELAFHECTSLTSVIIGNGVTSIGEYAFYGCTSLTSIVIPESVTSIGHSAFDGCSALTSVVIGNGVTSIGKYAFYGCTSLTSIVIPERMTSIGEAAFTCSSLTSISIPKSVTSIGHCAFSKCTSLTSIVIPKHVTSIGESAFYGCSSLTSIVIGNGVTSIEHNAFIDCSALTAITVSEDNPVYDSREDCNAIIETASNMLIAGCQSTIIPSSVTSIGKAAFYGCSSLMSIDIPSSVTSIGEAAFYGCSSLTSIDIPSSVASIGDDAFEACSALTAVICRAENVPELGVYYTFLDVPISEATLYVPASALEAYKAADQWEDFGTILPIEGNEDVINGISPASQES